MRLTALRQSPTDISRQPKNSMQMKSKSNLTIYTPHSSVTANLLPQNRENAGEQDGAMLRTAAAYMRPVVLTILPPCLN